MSRLGKAFRARLRDVLALALGLVLAALLLFLVEYTSARILRARGWPEYPLFYKAPAKLVARQGVAGPLMLSYLDPLLGYAASPTRNRLINEVPGFVQYGKPDAPIRIVALGGSTTDAMGAEISGDPHVDPQDPYNWPRDLQRMLSADGIEAVVFNGGTAGYTSSQDLFKLIRDGIALHPDIVIALEGVNDFALLLSVGGHRHVTKYQEQTLEAVVSQVRVPSVMPNFLILMLKGRFDDERMVDGYTLGVLDPITRANHWHRNLLLAEAACRAMGIQYLNVLQPVMGVGTYRLSDEERCMLDEWRRVNAENDMDYLTRLNRDYGAAKAHCDGTPECADFTEIFAGEARIYFDPLHPNERGVDVLARQIYQTLLQRGMLPFAPAGGAR